MSALVTQTITNTPRVLIISDQLSGLVSIKKFLQSQGLEIISTNTTGALAVLSPSTKWYKIFWLVPDLSTSDQVIIKKTIELIQVLGQWESVTTPLISLTTAIQAKDEVFEEWNEVVRQQYEYVSKIKENIDESRFIYYFNLAEKNKPPFAFFVQKLGSQRLLNPNINLGLLSPDGFGEVVTSNLLRPRSHPLVIVPTPKPSRDISEHIRELYFHYHQVDLEIFDYQAKTITHPVLEDIQEELEEIEVSERVFTALRPLVRQLPLVVEGDDQPKLSLDKLTKPALTALKQLTRSGVVPRKSVESRVKKTKTVFEPVAEVETMSTLNRAEERERLVLQLLEKKDRVLPEEDGAWVESSERVDSVFGLERFAQRRQHLQSLFQITKNTWQKNKHRRVVFLLGTLVTLVGVITLACVVATTILVNGMRQKLIAYTDAADESIEVQNKLQSELIGQYQSPLVGYYQNYIAPLVQPVFPNLQETLDLIALLEQFSVERKQFENTLVLGYGQLLGQEPGNSLTQFSQAATEAEQLYKTLSILQAQLEPLQTSKLTFEDKQALEYYQRKLEQTRLSLSRFQQLQPLFSPLLGGEGKRVYAVLFQNEQELRPTGGFIQAVAFLTFDKGILTSVQVEDVYSLDQKLSGVTEPPNEIKQFLGEQRWYLRDSNWNGDFPEAAKQISLFLEKSINQDVDGVIALNIKVLENLLLTTGSIELPEYNELITAKNIAERVEFHSEIQLGGDTKPDYSKALFSRIIDKVQGLKGLSMLDLAVVFEEQLQEKNAYIAITRGDEHSTFELLGWTGSLVRPACPTTLATNSNCVVDSIAQVEANIGVNRANYYIQRQIDHTIRLTQTQAQHTRVVKFTNTASSNAWPKGAYRAFTRFYLPRESVITSVVVDGQALEIGSLFHTTQGNFVVYGVVTETGVDQNTELQLTYSVPHSQKPPFAYAFFDQKQAGARDTSTRVFLEFSPNLQPTLIAPQADVQGNVIVFNPTQNTGHTFVGALFE